MWKDFIIFVFLLTFGYTNFYLEWNFICKHIHDQNIYLVIRTGHNNYILFRNFWFTDFHPFLYRSEWKLSVFRGLVIDYIVLINNEKKLLSAVMYLITEIEFIFICFLFVELGSVYERLESLLWKNEIYNRICRLTRLH